MPSLFIWCIWLARNRVVFDDMILLPTQYVTKYLSILTNFPQSGAIKKIRNVVEETINIKGRWVYFDGASQGAPAKAGARGIIYMSNNHYYKFVAGLRQCTNNKTK